MLSCSETPDFLSIHIGIMQSIFLLPLTCYSNSCSKSTMLFILFSPMYILAFIYTVMKLVSTQPIAVSSCREDYNVAPHK
jgi:hypothetical protein